MRFVLFLLQVWLGCAASRSLHAENIHYEIHPDKPHPNSTSWREGYEIVGGFIETNGSIGELSASSIVNYEIEIGGPAHLFLGLQIRTQ